MASKAIINTTARSGSRAGSVQCGHDAATPLTFRRKLNNLNANAKNVRARSAEIISAELPPPLIADPTPIPAKSPAHTVAATIILPA